jgi:hypothetical protein
MKKIYIFLFACTMTIGTMHAQKQYDCYRLQEFMFNAKTQAHDTPVEHPDFSKFVVDEQKMSLTQNYDDGTSTVLPIKSMNKADKQSVSYQVVSPANGFTYVYRVNPSSTVIEVLILQNNKETLLKKYLYRG